MISQRFILYHCPVGSNGIEYMDAGKDIRRRIHLVQNLNNKYKNIVALKAGRAQQMAIGIYGRYHQEQCHSRKQKNTVLVKLLLVLKKQIYKNRRHIHKPEQIGHDKPFYKGY